MQFEERYEKNVKEVADEILFCRTIETCKSAVPVC
jgi:hypothetical protein